MLDAVFEASTEFGARAARRISDDPPVNEMPEYLGKYREPIDALGRTLEQFSAMFTVALRSRSPGSGGISMRGAGTP